MRNFGIVLIVLGLLGFIIGNVTFTETEEVVDLGPLEVQAEQERSFPIAPAASGAAVVAGLVLVVVGSRSGKRA